MIGLSKIKFQALSEMQEAIRVRAGLWRRVG